MPKYRRDWSPTPTKPSRTTFSKNQRLNRVNMNLNRVKNVKENSNKSCRRAVWITCGLLGLLAIGAVILTTVILLNKQSEPLMTSTTAILILNQSLSGTTTTLTTGNITTSTAVTTVGVSSTSTNTVMTTVIASSSSISTSPITMISSTISVITTTSIISTTLITITTTFQSTTSTSALTTTTTAITTVTTCIPGISWNSIGITVAGITGAQGSNSSLLAYTNDIAVDIYFNIYVADTDNQRIQRFSINSSVGQTVAGVSGNAGSGSNQLNYPRAISVTGDVLFISDLYNYRIQQYYYNAASGTTIAGGNGVGSGSNQINVCYGVYVDPSGSVYFSDYNNNRVMKKLNTSSTGIVIAGNNGAGSALNQLNNPMGIYIDINNASILYVADSANHRIQRWIMGGSAGVTAAGGNSNGAALNQLNTPRAVIGDSDGNIFISDTNNHRIVMWLKGATVGVVIAGTSGSTGSTATMLSYPNGITFDENKNLYVADSNNFRIQKFLVCPVAPSTTTGGTMTTTTTVTAVPPCTPQASSGGLLYSVTNPTSSNYPTYTCYTYTWVATGSSATLSFFFRHDPGGWMLDDVNVYHGLTQLITNGGFESGSLTGWNYSGTCNLYIGLSYSGSSSAKSGNYYYYDRCANSGDTISQTFSTIAGDIYVISFWLTNYYCCGTTEIANITIT